eukprot:521722-Pyramimonas_sp.AAC.2
MASPIGLANLSTPSCPYLCSTLRPMMVTCTVVVFPGVQGGYRSVYRSGSGTGGARARVSEAAATREHLQLHE